LVLHVAGLWRTSPEVGEAWTMLTGAPGPRAAPYHNRQIVVLPAAEGPRWLDPAGPAREILKPLPGGVLPVEQG
jgi:putative SOS response-associated peptidase YedK